MRRSTLMILGLGLGVLAPLGCGDSATTPDTKPAGAAVAKDPSAPINLQNPYNTVEKKKK